MQRPWPKHQHTVPTGWARSKKVRSRVELSVELMYSGCAKHKTGFDRESARILDHYASQHFNVQRRC